AGTFVEIDLDDVVQNKVGNETIEFEYTWSYKEGSTDVAIPGNFKSTHKCYTIVDTPHEPCGIIAGSGASSEVPWLAIVDIATIWASGKNDGDVVADVVTSKINRDLNLEYDVSWGDTNYVSRTGGVKIANFLLFLKNGVANNSQLTNTTSITPISKMINCKDCGSLVVVFSNIIGSNLKRTSILATHSLNKIEPINQPACVPFGGSFSYHAFASRDNKIWDACLKVGRPDPVYNSTSWKLPIGMNHNVIEPAWITNGTDSTKGNQPIIIRMGGMNKGYIKITKVWQEANHHGNILTESGSHKYTLTCTQKATSTISGEFTLNCTRITGFVPTIIQANDTVKTCLFSSCNLFDISIKEGTFLFELGDKFEFCTEYDYTEYRGSLAAPDWFLPGIKGRTPASNLTTDTSFTLE
ncbi:MAG: hypothetical protein LBC74_14060, partial [Planctomycetaceae bacterium]|nr:hypothetical protein [Planctomycetaceae bacterium]